MLDSQIFGVTKDKHHPYLSTLTQPNRPEFTAEPSLPNEEVGPFSEDEDEVLCNQCQEDDEEEAKHVCPIITVPPYYTPPHMHNFEGMRMIITWILMKSNIW